MEEFDRKRDVGGTPGGLLEFILGGLMILVGCYLFFNNLVVQSTLISAWYGSASGVPLLAMLLGIGLLFFSRRSWIGWILVAIGGLMIMIHVITNLTILFRPTSFFNTLIMLGLIFGGLGLVARALRPH